MTGRIDVHAILSPVDPWLGEFQASIEGEPVNLHFVDRVEGDISQARTNGFTKGNSEFVCAVDPDDLVVPGIFAKCVTALDADSSLVAVYTDEYLIDANGRHLLPGWSINAQPFLKYGYNARIMQGMHHLLVIRRSAFEKCLPLKTKRMPELPLIYELRQLGTIGHIAEVGYYWRIHHRNGHDTYTPDEFAEVSLWIDLAAGVDEKPARVRAAASSCLGTPWHAQGRLPGVGIDTSGLLGICAAAAGIVVNRHTIDATGKWGETWINAMRHYGLVQTSIQNPAMNDVALFNTRRYGPPDHAGIISEVNPLSFIHVPIAGPRVCMESELSESWKVILHSLWRMPHG